MGVGLASQDDRTVRSMKFKGQPAKACVRLWQSEEIADPKA
jgi:hypothetical protein